MSSECYLGVKKTKKSTELVAFAISPQDRRKHVYTIGKTGMGKTTLLTNMILQDIFNGQGACFIDPHGDSAQYILDRIPANRHEDVIYFNPSDTDFPIGLNILEAKRGEAGFLINSMLMSVFNKIWAGMWSSRMEYILSNTLLTLLENDKNTLLGVIKLLTDEPFRRKITNRLKDPIIKNFWQMEFNKFNERYRQEAIAPILNKIGQFFSSQVIRNILGQVESSFDFREIMDEGKILIVNLSKGKLGEENSNLLGSLLISKLEIAAMSRVDMPEKDRKDFFVYIDEFQNFTTDSFAGILSEARKYGLNLVLAHQYTHQLTPAVLNAVFGNVGTLISFATSYTDAEKISKELAGVLSPTQIVSLNRGQIAVKMTIDGQYTKPFVGETLTPLFDEFGGQGEKVIAISRNKYGRTRAKVEKDINKYLEAKDEEIKKPTP